MIPQTAMIGNATRSGRANALQRRATILTINPRANALTPPFDPLVITRPAQRTVQNHNQERAATTPRPIAMFAINTADPAATVAKTFANPSQPVASF